MFKKCWHKAETIRIMHRSDALKICAFIIFLCNDLKFKIANKVRNKK